jgi:hypothetical protein
MEAPAIGVWTEKMRRVWKSFCCLQARTIDFAKFGRLYLNKGTGKEIRLFQEHG